MEVSVDGGASFTSAGYRFRYYHEAMVESASPSSGPAAGGTLVSVTGFILNFPNFEQGRELMQTANVVHAIAAVLFLVMGLSHIYLGTIGVEGAYEAMRTGYVDETWAKEHHEFWYREAIAQDKGGGSTSPAVAAAMKEGWK